MKRQAFTIVELLVVISVIGVLMGLLLPAVQSARQAARSVQCKNNLRQLGIALSNYQNSFQSLPPSGFYPPGQKADDWSAHARLLPYLEQAALQDLIDWRFPYSQQGHVAKLRIDTFVCPSEIRAEVRPSPKPNDPDFAYFPLNYAINFGTWFVYSPEEQMGGDGIVYPNSNVRLEWIYDGASNTLAFAEVKAWNPYLRDSNALRNLLASAPSRPGQVVALGGNFKTNSGHTEWVDGRVHQTGFTATFTPNTQVIHKVDNIEYDVDFNSFREGKSTGNLTYAAVTARSYHPNGVNTVFCDGSVHFKTDTISPEIWRAMATRQSGEIVEHDH